MPMCSRIAGAFFFLFVLLLEAADTRVYRGPENSGVYAEKGLLKEGPPGGPKLLQEKDCTPQPTTPVPAARTGPAARSDVEPLVAGVRAADLPFARASAEALGRIGIDAAPAISNLVTAIGGRDVELARASVGALGAIGRAVNDVVEPALLAALRHGDEAVRTNAVAALRSIGRDPVPPLVAILKGSDRRLAPWAASALGRLGQDGKSAIPDLVSRLKDKDRQMVSAAVEALGGIGHAAAGTMPDLMALSRGADKRLGETIQRAIERVKIDNQAPTAFDVKTVCEEGGTVTVSLPVSDPDDVVDTLVASVVQGPVHGTLARLSNTQFMYRAAYGVVEDDAFTWKTADRTNSSGVATASIAVSSDKSSPVVTQAFMWTNTPSVRIEFDEPLLTNVAMDVRNYKIEPDVQIVGAQMDTNGMAVSLYTGPIVEGKSYALTLRKLRDRAKAGNALTARLPMTCLTSGLACDYYESVAGIFEKDLFDLIQPKTNGVVKAVNLSLRQRDESFDMRFQGFLKTQTAGDYTFWLTADDRARLYLGTNMVVESANRREKSGSVRLTAGAQPLCLIYIQTGGTNILDAAWSGPGFGKRPIPPSALFCKFTGD